MKTFAIAALCVFGLVGGVSIYADQANNANASVNHSVNHTVRPDRGPASISVDYTGYSHNVENTKHGLNRGACWDSWLNYQPNSREWRCQLY